VRDTTLFVKRARERKSDHHPLFYHRRSPFILPLPNPNEDSRITTIILEEKGLKSLVVSSYFLGVINLILTFSPSI